MAQQPQPFTTIINNFFRGTPPPEPVKQPQVATLQRSSNAPQGAQERTEDEVTRLERKIQQQQKQMESLLGQIRQSRGTNQALLSQYRTTEAAMKRNVELCDNLRRQCNQLDEAKTVGRTARLMEDLQLEKKEALQGVTLAGVDRTTVDSRITDRQMDKLFGRLTGTQHRDEDEEMEANDELYERLMQQEPVYANTTTTKTNHNGPVTTAPSRTTTNNRAIEDFLKF